MTSVLVKILSTHRLSYFALLCSFLVITCFEVVGVGVVPVFAAALAAPTMVRAKMDFFMDTDGMSQEKIIVILGIGMIGFFIVKNVVLSVIANFQGVFIASRQADLSSLLFRSYLDQPYLFHLQRHSAELLRNVTGVTFSLFNGVVVPGCMLITELLVASTVAGLLLIASPIPTLVSLFVMSGFIWLFYFSYKKKISGLGAKQQEDAIEMIKCVNQGLGGIKEIKVLGREEFFVKRFDQYIHSYSQANTYLAIISQFPRYFIETLAISGIGLVVMVMLARGSSIDTIVPVLSLLAVASMRLIPSMNRIIGAITSIRFNKNTIEIIGCEFTAIEQFIKNQGRGNAPRLVFKEAIRLSNVSYRYPDSDKNALDNISITIPKGNMVALVGQSGAGKTTLADLILGLYFPSEGRAFADGTDLHENISSWQKNIGYVPQSIYISDDSIRNNVAFGVAPHEIDDAKVRSALKSAQLSEFVEALPLGINTVIGEHGSRLSGGQRQRIGIARAMYHDPDVLILDEATSALDNNTENEIANALLSLKGSKTIIVIAHRLSTIKRSEILFLLQDGHLLAQGSYDDLAANSEVFQTLTDLRNQMAAEIQPI